MKTKFVLLVVVLIGQFSSSGALGRTGSFSQLAYQTIHTTWRDLSGYGIVNLSPWDPRLPRPQVPAMEAVVTSRLGLLAYYDEENLGFVSTLLFKAPNGGQRHGITFHREFIEFLTPYAGVVAHANRFMTVNGPGYNFYCQSRLVNEAEFYACIESLYINVIVNQLKRYAD